MGFGIRQNLSTSINDSCTSVSRLRLGKNVTLQITLVNILNVMREHSDLLSQCNRNLSPQR
jgi:hypothetical protein